MVKDQMELTSPLSRDSAGDREEEPLTQKAEDAATADEEETKSILSRLHKWVLLIWLLLAYLACNMGYSLIAPFFPEEAEAKGVSSAAVGLVIASTPLTVVVFSPVIGYQLPRIGVLLLITTGLVIVGTSNIALAFVVLIDSTWGFVTTSILLRITEGFGSALYMTAAYAIAPTLFPSHITVIMGLFQAMCGVGYGLGFVFGGLLYEFYGYKVPFLSIGGFILVITIPCALLARKTKFEATKVPLHLILKLLTDSVLILLVLAVILSAALPTFYTPDIELYLTDEFDESNIGVAIVLLLQATVFTLTSFLAAPLVEKLGNSTYFSVFGLAIGSLSYFIMGQPIFSGYSNIWVVRVSFAINAIGSAFGILPIYANLIMVARKHMVKGDSETSLTALIAGVVASAILLGESVGAILGGALNTFMSYPESSFLFAELLLTPVLMVIGVKIIDRIIRALSY